MSIISWNCQGAGSTETVQHLRELRKDHFPDFLFLMETKNKREYLVGLQKEFGYDEVLTVEPVGLSGGLAVFWKSCYEVEVLVADKRIIDLKVKAGTLVFFISCIYGDPVRERRRVVWDRLSAIGMARNEAWILAGDFNELLKASEKEGGPIREEHTFWDFRNMVENCKVREIKSSGNQLSWAGWRNRVWVQCRLDRSFGNDEWFQLFPKAHMEYLAMLTSDHRPILVRFAFEDREMGRGRFVFDKRLAKMKGVEEIVRYGWGFDTLEHQKISVTERINRCRKELSRWKRITSVAAGGRIKRLKDALEVEISKRAPSWIRMKRLKQELSRAYRAEEGFWRQRSRIRWLKLGDRNTKYFHLCAKIRKMRNRILMLKDLQGREQFTEGSKGNIATEYFRDLFTSSNPWDLESLFDGFQSRVSGEMNAMLTAPVMDNEIKEAAFSIKSDSAPGADGLTGTFYKRFWEIVGPSTVKEVQEFFRTSVLPAGWNHTHICLLPKVANPTTMPELRPISLCSVHYKIVSKILCNRLKRILPEIVSETQGAFVGGRLISDNILIAHEMVHALRTKEGIDENFMAIKTDMSKAYDRVEWCFVEVLLERMGFDRRWVSWIMSCITSVTYSVLINGGQHGFIRPERGIRQGDPLSPFLFILCAEALVSTLNQAETSGKLTGIRFSADGPSVHHLLFADDSLLLSRATGEESAEIMRRLKLYGDASGQVINTSKSSIIFGTKVPQIVRAEVKLELDIATEGGEGTYLGLPESFSGSKRKLLSFIQDKVQARLRGGGSKVLSQGGKEVILKSVGLALPVFAMSCFRLPKTLCAKLTSIMTEFWWGGTAEKKKIPWVAWKKLCKAKELGGMGFHDIENFNQALLCKQAWRIWSSPHSLLARVMKSRYFRRSEFLECAIGSRPSYAWRSILHGRELLLHGLLKRVGNGRDTHVWYENWLLADVPRPPRYRTDEVDLTLRVSDLIDERYGSWNAERIRHLFVAEDAECILNMKVNLGQNDAWVWGFSKNGSYNSQSGYKLIDLIQMVTHPTTPSLPPVEQRLWSNLWKVKTLPKIRHFMWRALAGALAVAERLRSRGIGIDNTCKVCHSQSETICHILFHCPIAEEVWRLSGFPLPAAGFSQNSVFLNLHHLMEVSKKRQSNERTCMNFPWILWHLWKARNMLVFERVRVEATGIWERINLEVEAWSEANKADDEEEDNGALSLNASLPWQKPCDTFVKCNIGTSFVNGSQNCGASWLVRNHTGKALTHSRRSYSAVLSSLEADLLGVAWAVECTVTMRYERVVFESSSYLAGEAILHPERFLQFQPLIDKIRNQLSCLRLWSFAFVHKVGNRCAEEIANSVTRDQRYSSYIARDGPFWLSSWLQEEANQEGL